MIGCTYFLIYIKGPTLIKRSFASHCFSPPKTKTQSVTLFLSKVKKFSKLHSLHISGKLFYLAKKITIKHTIQNFFLFLLSCLRDNKSAFNRLNKKLTNKVLLCNHWKFYLELNAPKTNFSIEPYLISKARYGVETQQMLVRVKL